MAEYLAPWVSTKERMPDDGEEIFAKTLELFGTEREREIISHCIFKKEYGVHKNAFVLQSCIDRENIYYGWVRLNVMCWMPIPPHIDLNGDIEECRD